MKVVAALLAAAATTALAVRTPVFPQQWYVCHVRLPCSAAVARGVANAAPGRRRGALPPHTPPCTTTSALPPASCTPPFPRHCRTSVVTQHVAINQGGSPGANGGACAACALPLLQVCGCFRPGGTA